MAATFEPRSLATGEPLGRIRSASAADVAGAVVRAAGPQPLWAAVPTEARAGYLRRAAQAILDELEGLAGLLAEETGLPRTEALLAELLPSVGGLHSLAADGPRALAEQRLGRLPLLRAGRRSTLMNTPVGVVGVRSGTASPWQESALEVGAALLAGNGVVLAPSADLAARRLAAAFERAGVPDGLVQVVHGSEAAAALGDHCARVVDGEPAGRKGTMLILAGAPPEQTVPGALWAAFAGAGLHSAAVGRVVVAGSADELARQLESGARRLQVGDPRRAETEVGPLRSQEDLARLEELLEDARERGAEVLCGGPAQVPGLTGAFFAPAVLRGVPAAARVLQEPVPGPVLAIVEAASETEAISLADEDSPSVSVWAGDRRHADRVARTLHAGLTWVNEHGVASPAAPVRLARHVEPRQLASQPVRLRSARWLPYDPALVRASTAAARLMHGRESERGSALRDGALPLARTAVRLAREALRR
jgi:acyl-CoA reductase-like NAD-dependent aldehyde dehydrogenase